MRQPAYRIPNRELAEATGKDVIQLDVVPVAAGDLVEVRIGSTNSARGYPQGVWLGTEGVLHLPQVGARANQFVLWAATAPPVVPVGVEETDGLLRVYNVWDRTGIGDGLRYNSLLRTSGMLRTDHRDGSIEYRCNDSGFDPPFDSIVFTLTVGRPDAPSTGRARWRTRRAARG